ncbi:uncharacterized protein EV420DRAFT_753387 [Desarmillaria tabescens]|uniref:NYN domain-containing protein n=1 Tax=Armillaria tabescens TaxID=1929756 RepID=A0AA39MY25_ARMTA|nr:uncharacterized protein EV420DRAFT_753387 [Desarmillaria tabescens]KAK0450408.1 hypothetical protein EV420DRAFT_753387 [Desarmillaria tabescens]
MFQSSSDTSVNSPTPISLFSNDSVPSEPTSDEQPNLGAFTTVLREWNYLQPPRRINPVTAVRQTSTTTTSTTTSQTQSSITPSDYSHSELEYDSDLRPEGSTVWSHKPIASYLKLDETATETDQDFDEYYSDYLDAQSTASYTVPRSAHTPSPHASLLVPTDSEVKPYSDVSDEQGYYSSDTEGDPQSRTVYIEDGSDLDLVITNDDGSVDMTKDADEEEVMPTLGFQETLNFLADEREKLTAQRDAGTIGQYNGRLVSLSAAAEPRRKRRRRRTKTPRAQSTGPSTLSTTVTSATPNESMTTTADHDPDQDADESSSSYDRYYSTTSNPNDNVYKSTPGTPARRGRQRQSRLRSTKSTPQLRIPAERPDDKRSGMHRLFLDEQDVPRVRQMKSLMKKLCQLFPEDREYLKQVSLKTMEPPEIISPGPIDHDGVEDLLGGFVDTRGPPPQQTNERLIHVFVDQIVKFLKRYPNRHPQARLAPSITKLRRHLSHSALSLILERGRPVSRRVLVASSPLYQRLESANQLGYEVRTLARVPDMGDGADRNTDSRAKSGHIRSQSGGSGVVVGRTPASAANIGIIVGQGASPRPSRLRSGSVNTAPTGGRKKGHLRRISGSTSTESEQGGGGSGSGSAGTLSQVLLRSITTGVSISPPGQLSLVMPNSQGNTPPARIRYREQGVDELLQLKLHQALASIDGPPPPGSTIILATGDGNAGQFNEDGFLGTVRTALKKGWKVELYAWEGGMSKAWKREFGEGSEWGSGQMFRIVGMEQFGGELVEVYTYSAGGDGE